MGLRGLVEVHHGRMEVVIAEAEIRFANYEFPGATVYPGGVVPVPEIRDIDTRAMPPEVRTVHGETLFLPELCLPELDEFRRRNAIPVQRRPDIWSDLLEPFLDTSFAPEHRRATEERLERAGLSLAEVAEIRRKIQPVMVAYNFDSMLWEWVHLGLFDLLSAASGSLVPPAVCQTLGDPASLYSWAMHIAELTRENNVQAEDTEKNVRQ